MRTLWLVAKLINKLGLIYYVFLKVLLTVVSDLVGGFCLNSKPMLLFDMSYC